MAELNRKALIHMQGYSNSSYDAFLFEDCANKAWEWLGWRYNITIPMCEYYGSNHCTHAVYFSDKKKVRIELQRKFWLTYKRKRIGLWANMIPCTLEESWMLQFIHEFTHYIQYECKMKHGEHETTSNEIAYAQAHFPKLHKQLCSVDEH
jgi:hypothetical protein